LKKLHGLYVEFMKQYRISHGEISRLS